MFILGTIAMTAPPAPAPPAGGGRGAQDTMRHILRPWYFLSLFYYTTHTLMCSASSSGMGDSGMLFSFFFFFLQIHYFYRNYLEPQPHVIKIGSVRYQHPYIISLVSAKPGKILPSVKKKFFGGWYLALCALVLHLL